MLIVYFGISMTISSLPIKAWQERREVGLTPGLVEQVVFGFGRFRQGFEAFAHNDVAGGAGTGFLAGMFYLDTVVEQDIADRYALLCIDDCTIGTQLDVGQDDQLRHGVSCRMDLLIWLGSAASTPSQNSTRASTA